VGRDGEHVQLVIDDETIVAPAEREKETLVEAGNDVLVRMSSVACVNILNDMDEMEKRSVA
jgi:hypothetical protein